MGLIIGPFPEKITGRSAPGGIAGHIGGLFDFLELKGISVSMCYHRPFNVKKDGILNSTKKEWLSAIIHGFFLLLFEKKHNFFDYSIRHNVAITYYVSTLKKYLKKISWDFIHIHSLHNPAAIAVKYLNYKGQIIITDHGFYSNEHYKTKKMRILLEQNYAIADKIVYISDFSYSRHNEEKLGNLGKLIKINNPFHFNGYPKKIYTQSNDKNSEMKKIFFNGYGRSMKIKGLDILLHTMNRYPDLYKGIKLLLLCNENATKYVKKNVWNFDYELIGRTTHKNVLNIYSDADILVVPSRSESFGLVYIEALAIGIPVIGYYGVINEFKGALNSYIGESFDPSCEDEASLMEKIKNCLTMPFDADRVREGLINNYSWDILGHKFISLYYPE
jgi:glycosyltransferase involved in cell wall biosynthesis